MKWPLFENKIKDELSGHRSEVDIDALWSNIEPEVDAINKSKRKKRFGVIWFLLAGVLLIGSGAAFYFLNNSEVSNATVATESVLEEKINNGNEIDLNKNSSTSTNNTTNAVEKNTDNKESNITNEGLKESAFNNKLNKKSNNNTDLKNNKKTVFKNNTAKEDKEQIKNTLTEKPIANTDFNNNNDLNLNPKNLSDAALDETPETINENSETPNKERISGSIQKIAVLELLPFKIKTNIPQIRIPPLKGVLSGNAIATESTVDKRHPMGNKDFKFSIGANGGISYANRNLSTIDSSGNDLINMREKSEKQLETTHLGLQFNLRHTSGFEISSGLQYTRMVERFDYLENITKVDSLDGILYYAVNPNNDTLAVMGTVPHTINTDIRKKYYNRYTMFDIPVLVGYFKENDNWSYGAQAGVFANISLKTEGHFLKNETQDEDIKDLFKSSVGLSYYLGISAGYKLNDNIEIGISPHVRYFPKNFAKDSYSISQKYTLFGLDARVRYWF